MYTSPESLNNFNYQGVYPCPVCRVGHIETMPLMEAMACNCCRHIFTVDLEQQQLKMLDRHPPLMWRWNGKNWLGGHLEGVEWGWIHWLFAVGFVVLPTTIIGLAAYLFPPAPSSALSWLPAIWTGLAFVSHLAIICWLVIEFYQFPIGVYLRVRRQQLLNYRPNFRV